MTKKSETNPLSRVEKNSFKPPRILICGPPGVGKTTFAADAPNPIFILTEDGLGDMDISHFPVAKTFEEVIDAVSSLMTCDHEYQTLVIDSMDWLQDLIFDYVCRKHNAACIEDANGGYGKGYVEAMRHWRMLLESINQLRLRKNMGIVFTAHTEVRKVQDPRVPTYDTYALKLAKKSSSVVEEYCDAIFFACEDIVVTNEKDSGKKRARALEQADRVIHTNLSPLYVAKNRYNLPATLPLKWDAFAAALKKSRGQRK